MATRSEGRIAVSALLMLDAVVVASAAQKMGRGELLLAVVPSGVLLTTVFVLDRERFLGLRRRVPASVRTWLGVTLFATATVAALRISRLTVGGFVLLFGPQTLFVNLAACMNARFFSRMN